MGTVKVVNGLQNTIFNAFKTLGVNFQDNSFKIDGIRAF